MAVKTTQALKAAAHSIGPNYRRERALRRGTGVLRFTRVIAYLTAVLTALGALGQAFNQLTAGAVSIALPVQQFWPSLPKGASIEGATAHVVGGGFTSAMVSVDGLDTAARIWLAAGTLLQGATVTTIALVIVFLCSRALKNATFGPGLTRGIRFAALVVMVGGIAWQVCGAISGGLASAQVLRWTGAEFQNTTPFGDDLHRIMGIPEATYSGYQVDFWPIGVGLALLCVAAAFRYGSTLQKDTEGLV